MKYTYRLVVTAEDQDQGSASRRIEQALKDEVIFGRIFQSLSYKDYKNAMRQVHLGVGPCLPPKEDAEPSKSE